MKNYRILKTYENYTGAGDDLPTSINDMPRENVSQEEINKRIKEIITNILKMKQYFALLQDTAEHVYSTLEKQFPQNREAFIDAIFQKDEILSILIENISDALFDSCALTEIEDVNNYLKKLEIYTEGNLDNLFIKVGDDFEEEDDIDDSEDEGEEVDIDEDDDQIKESKKSSIHKKMENFIKKHKKEEEKVEPKTEKIPVNGKFKKGEKVYLNGLTTAVAKKLNGRKCEIVGETKEKENCYDLYDPTSPKSEDGSNINGMPSEYIFREKPTVIIDTAPTRRQKVGKKLEKK